MKKLLIFLMVAIPLVVIVVLNLTVKTVSGYVSVSVDNVVITDTVVNGTIGQVYKLTAEIEPSNATNKKISWKSDNEDVAVVDKDGNVSFVSYGKCYITATSEDGNKKSSCYFYITDTIAHDIDLYIEKDEIEVGEKIQLVATIFPVEAINKEIEYKSYDESVATIDANGVIEAKKSGYVTLSATAIESDITRFISVHIFKPITALVLSKERAVISSANYQIEYQTYPLDATLTKLSFSSSDDSIATVNKTGIVTFSKAGTVDIKIKSEDGRINEKMTLTSTGGYVEQIYVNESIINARLGDAAKYIEIKTEPENISLDELQVQSENPEVCYVDEDNYIQFASTGSAIIRIRAEKSEGVFIEKTIFVHVEYPAEQITIDSVCWTAHSSIKLNPISFPHISTNQKFFYHLISGDATVSETGVVSFSQQTSSEAQIKIFANEDNSEVYKIVKVVYTAGYAKDISLRQTKIELEVGDIFIPAFETFPNSSVVKNSSYEIISQTKNGGVGEVIEIVDGVIKCLHGGAVDVLVETEKYNGETQEFVLNITVKRYSSEIAFECDLDYVDGIYVTAQPTLNFNSYLLPLDVSTNVIDWEITSGQAILQNNSLKFNSKGIVTLYGVSKDGKSTKAITLNYVGPNPLRATLSEVPNEIYVGDTFEFSVIQTFPHNAMLRDIAYSISNHNTSSMQSNKVIDIVDGKLFAKAGGTCLVTVYVSSSYQTSFEIEVIRLPESLVVTPADIQTTKTEISLTALVLPYDTTNKSVEFETSDVSVATVVDGVLTFNKNGIISITAWCISKPTIKHIFNIEKIDKTTSSISPTNLNIKMQIGEHSVFDVDEFCSSYDSVSVDITQTDEVIEIQEDIIIAKKLGNGEINLFFYDTNGTIVAHHKITISVIKLVESFTVFDELDYYNGEYQTAMPNVALSNTVEPNDASNKTLRYTIIESYTNAGEASNEISYIENDGLVFLQSGITILKIETTDGSEVSKLVRVRFTGGNATEAKLNVVSPIYMNVGETLSISVSSWIPKNTTNKQVFTELVYQSSTTDVVSISGSVITALSGGYCRIRVDISSGISKLINITVNKQVESIVVESSKILTSQKTYRIASTVLPTDATNKTLQYTLLNTDIATILGNTLTFVRAGTVYVMLSSTDGSEISKTLKIESTFGNMSEIKLSSNQITTSKNSQIALSIKSFLPSDILFNNDNISYNIINSNPIIPEKDVIQVNGSGLIKGLNGGTCTVRVSYKNDDNTLIYDDCEITVAQSLTSFDIQYQKEVDNVFGTVTVGTSILDYRVVATPLDSQIVSFRAISSSSLIARVTNSKISFIKEGNVDVEFIATDLFGGVIRKTVSYYYTNGKIVSATLDMSEFEGSTLTLDSGTNYSFNFISYIPRDLQISQIAMTDKNEIRNSSDLPVLEFNNLQISALNGGQVSFKLTFNNYTTDLLKIKVVRYATSISTETTLYTASGGQSISYSVFPRDTTDKTVEFVALDEEIATIDTIGNIDFSQFGEARFLVRLKNYPAISKTVTVIYSNTVNKIFFSNTTTSIFVRETLQLSLGWEPFGASDFTVHYLSYSPDLVTVSTTGKVIAQNMPGIARIYAYVVGSPDIYADIYIQVKQIISDIELELDAVDDDCGIGRYRVFGDSWFSNVDGQTIITQTYQMGIKYINPAGDYSGLLWSTSDAEIAAIDQTGKLTFTGTPGDVTVTVQPIDQLTTNEEYFLKDSYTFHIVKGINVYNREQMRLALYYLVGSIVVQKDIKYDLKETFMLNKSLHGNGHLVDMSLDRYDQGGYIRMNASVTGIVIDNIQLRGATFEENSALSQLEGKGQILRIEENVEAGTKTNVVVKNSIIENGVIAVCVVGADATVTGCIIRNTFSAGLAISNSDNQVPSYVTVNDCIFKSSMLSSILFDVKDNFSSSAPLTKLTVTGDLKIINWIKIDEVGGEVITERVGETASQIRDTIRSYTQFCKRYDGEDYFMAGICAFKAGYDGVLTYQSVLNVDMSGMSSKYQYVYCDISGAAKIFGIGVTYNLMGYTYPSNYNDITPDSKIEDDPNAYESIRQPR